MGRFKGPVRQLFLALAVCTLQVRIITKMLAALRKLSLDTPAHQHQAPQAPLSPLFDHLKKSKVSERKKGLWINSVYLSVYVYIRDYTATP